MNKRAKLTWIGLVFGSLALCWVVFYLFGYWIAEHMPGSESVFQHKLLQIWLGKISLYALLISLLFLLSINLRVLAFSFLFFFFGVEVMLHAQSFYMSHQYPNEKLGTRLWQYDSLLGWKKYPSSERYYNSPKDHLKIKISTNSKGLRDNEYAYEKKAGIVRILLLGDSVVEGIQVAKEALIDTQLEVLLRADGKYEVINAGTQGYGTDQSYLFLKEEGYKYSPDIIIYVAVNNDPIENISIHQRERAYGKSYFVTDENDQLVLKGVPVPKFEANDPWVMSIPMAKEFYGGELEKKQEEQTAPSFFRSVKEDFSHFRFYQWLRSRVNQNTDLESFMRKIGLKEMELAEISKPDAVAKEQYRMTKRLTQAMGDFSKSIESRFLVYEFTNGVGDKPVRPTDVEKMCQELGFNYLNSFDEFYRISKGKKTFCFRYDGHWNQKGHQLAAESIYQSLKREGWIHG